ncbi:MAG: S-layer homology domain-containing protein [Clostridiales bacterium]|nr:S-layer homology domain-containing protein [Clostridiales bacterium]
MKHWIKRAMSAALTALLLVSCFPWASAAEDPPLTRGETAATLLAAAKDYNEDVTYEDILKGYPDGSLHKDDPVTRVQALVMLQRAFDGLPAPVGDNARSGYPAANFTDIPAWAKTELQSVLASGIVAGTSATTFSPDRPITEKQLDLFLRRTYALEGSNLKDDFYATVNKTALDNSVIQPGYSGTSTLTDLSIQVSDEVSGLIQELVSGGAKTEGERQIVHFYNNILDTDARNQAGITPIQPYLTAIDQAKTVEELMEVHAKIYKETGVNALLGFGLTIDAKNSDQCVLIFAGASPALGKYGYAGATEAQKTAYLTYLTDLLVLLGQSKADAQAQAELVWQTDTALAAASMDNQELGDVDKTYNIYTMDQLQAMFPGTDLAALFALTGLVQTDRLQVLDPGQLQAWGKVFASENALAVLKAYCRLSLATSLGQALHEDFQKTAETFNQNYLGVSGSLSKEEQAAQFVQTYFSDGLGMSYVDRCFSAEAKAGVERMVQDILAVYRQRIQALDWMSQTTKEKALNKLDTMQLNLGYPNDWEDSMAGVPILSQDEGGSFYQNLLAINQALREQSIALQKEGVPEELWGMTVYTVNAMYLPSANSITFPAGILQAPLYDVDASYEENLGGIGYVIAHEITHAFDNNGAKYDENGNAADWWTAEDYAAFQQRCAQVVDLYDGVEAAPGIVCSGELTLSENIADLGAVACITEIAGRLEDPDYAALYTAVAETWYASYPRQIRAYLAQNDVHAPDKLRANVVLQNFDAFYEAFGITEDDAMWLSPEQRVTIW